jgi:carbonic anhydrase
MRWSHHAVLRKERRMSIMDRLRKRNEKFAEDFDRGDAPMPPAERFVVLTCMDARLHPESFLGMEIGDAHVLRNAGGRASDTRSARSSSPAVSSAHRSTRSSTTPIAGC